MKRKIQFYLFACIFMHFNVYAQYGKINTNKAKALMSGKIKVITQKNDTNGYNEALKFSIEKNWNASQYEYISDDNLNSIVPVGNDAYLFGYFTGIIENSKYVISNIYIFGVVNKNRGYKYYRTAKDLSSVMFMPFVGIDKNYLKEYLSLYVKIINWSIKLVANEPNLCSNIMWITKYANKFTGKVKSSKLLICDKDFYVEDKTKIKKYTSPYEVVTRERIAKAITDNEDVYIYILSEFSATFSSHQIVNAKTGELIFQQTGNLNVGKAQIRIFNKLSQAKVETN